MIDTILTWIAHVFAWFIVITSGITLYQAIYDHKAERYSRGVNHFGAISVIAGVVWAINWIVTHQ